MTEQSKVRRPAMMMHMTHFIAGQTFPSPETDADTDTDPIPSLHRHPHVSRSSKSNAVSSLFLSHFSYTPPPPEPTTVLTPKKKAAAAFRGLGCTAGAAKQVSVPAVIRSAAEWEGKRVKKKKNPHHRNRKRESFKLSSESSNSEGNCLTMPDVWCGAGIGFSAETTVGSTASSATRKNVGLINGRGKIDGEKIMNPREREKERPSCPSRRAAVNAEAVSLQEAERAFLTSHPEPDVFRTRHVRHPSPGGLAEILVQNRFIMGGRSDRFSNWRLNIDHMTYEQLLELGDKIGYVNTGLKEKDLERCVQKVKLSVMSKLAVRSLISEDKKCTVCQEECEGDDELGLLKCGHGFHIQCINQWLAQKNACPVCKTEPVARG